MAQVIEQPARRGDDHVHAAAKGVFLRPHSDAADDHRGGQRRVRGESVELFDDLRGELTRWREDERARFSARASEKLVENRKKKRGGLAASRHRAGENVAAFERRRNCVGLNWSGADEAEVLEPFEEIAVELKCAESH